MEKLSVKSINDILEYYYDSYSSRIIFNYNEMKYPFKLSFYKFQSYTYMVASSENPIVVNNLPVFINSFFEKKINSTPVEVYYFEALLKNNDIFLN